jgi:membrane-associated phospholipid phosphatase
MDVAGSGPARGSRFLPAERVLLGYLALSGLVALSRLGSIPACVWVVVANALYVGLILVFRRAPLSGFGRGLRELYPLLLLTALYSELDILSGWGGIATHDETVQAWEARLFGGQVSREWWQLHPSALWSTLLHGMYFAYYPIIVIPVFYFLFRGDRLACRRSMLWLMATFALCYTAFIFFPVAGPYYEFPRPSPEFLANPMAHLVYRTLATGSAYGAAFPSSHVAVTLVATAAAWYGVRWLGLALIVPAVLLAVGVVYCQMHYAVDALAGAGLAGVIVLVGRWADRRQGLETNED